MEASYDFILVALSFVISVLGSFTALRLATRLPSLPKEKLWPWLLAAAGALGGCAIWSMHFIAMLAYQTSMPVTYDLLLTVLSAILAVAVSGAGLFIMGRGKTGLGRLSFAALLTGLGVAAMHYTGMAAMQMPADLKYDSTLVLASLAIAVVAAAAALWLAFNLRGNWQRFGSALVMGIAVCGMHYTGMAAVTMIPNAAKAVPSGGVGANALAITIFAIAVVLMIAGLVASTKPVQEDLVFEI
ncbi:MAG: hypothetical protein K0U98_06800 [Deltaproteobacteria bacterium]|nr:hypothetical protein [Deltaproteobacteria bacterium]